MDPEGFRHPRQVPSLGWRASAEWGPIHPPRQDSTLGARSVEPMEITRRPSVTSVFSVVIPAPPRIEPQRALRTQRADGIHDFLPVSDGGHRYDGGPSTPRQKPPDLSAQDVERRESCGDPLRPPRSSVVNPFQLPNPGPQASAGGRFEVGSVKEEVGVPGVHRSVISSNFTLHTSSAPPCSPW